MMLPDIYIKATCVVLGGSCLITYLIWRWFGGWDA
jgi:hypothetical protein